ncbi:MAG: ABC transporter permease, partial [Gemmataceae bacterium]
MALAVSVLILGNFMLDAVTYVLESEFELAQRQDVSVTFFDPRSSEVIYDLGHLPGVQHVQPFRVVPARLRFGHRSRRLAIMGVEPGGQLYRLMNLERELIDVPPDGVVISQKLGELLDVGVGDLLTVEVLEGDRPVREVPIRALVTDFSGLSAYMDIEAVNRLMREGPVVSGAYVAVDDRYLDELYSELKSTPRVAGVTLRTAALTSFRETVAENLLRMRMINVIFASIIAFGVVYNSARISLSERSRELATLRVIGFTRAEISLILFGELAILTLAAIPLGLWIGRQLAGFVVMSAYNTELFRIPLIVSPMTYGFASTVTLVAAIFSALVVRRMIDQLDLVAVLKSKE